MLFFMYFRGFSWFFHPFRRSLVRLPPDPVGLMCSRASVGAVEGLRSVSPIILDPLEAMRSLFEGILDL